MLKLNVGSNRKIGLPDYGSAGASCNLEVELDTGLFQDLEGLHQVVQRAYAACNQAVQDELARLKGTAVGHDPDDRIVEVRTAQPVRGVRLTKTASGDARSAGTAGSQIRPATVSQIRAIRAIAARQRIDLASLLRDRFGVVAAGELGIRQASELIDELKGDGGVGESIVGANGNGSHAAKGGGR